MSLNENFERVTIPAAHYVYLERVGPFHETAPAAWQKVAGKLPKLLKIGKVGIGMSLYKVAPQIYRAGFTMAQKPDCIPEEMHYAHFEGGNYLRFVLTGSYSQLPQACGRVFEIVQEMKIATVDERFNIEAYPTDPNSTPEEQLITEILVPVD